MTNYDKFIGGEIIDIEKTQSGELSIIKTNFGDMYICGNKLKLEDTRSWRSKWDDEVVRFTSGAASHKFTQDGLIVWPEFRTRTDLGDSIWSFDFAIKDKGEFFNKIFNLVSNEGEYSDVWEMTSYMGGLPKQIYKFDIHFSYRGIEFKLQREYLKHFPDEVDGIFYINGAKLLKNIDTHVIGKNLWKRDYSNYKMWNIGDMFHIDPMVEWAHRDKISFRVDDVYAIAVLMQDKPLDQFVEVKLSTGDCVSLKNQKDGVFIKRGDDDIIITGMTLWDILQEYPKVATYKQFHNIYHGKK